MRREELHHVVDLLPEAELRPAPGLIRTHAAWEHGPETDLYFFASSEADPDLAEPQAEVTFLRSFDGDGFKVAELQGTGIGRGCRRRWRTRRYTAGWRRAEERAA